jgi:protein gp37
LRGFEVAGGLMADRTGISWTEATWNPTVGCSKISPGCENCYAMGAAHRITAQHEGNPKIVESAYLPALTVMGDRGPEWTGEVRVNARVLDQPSRWRRPRRVFVNSMSDLFHVDLKADDVRAVFDQMAAAPRHVYQVLTKRAGRMRDMVNSGQLGAVGSNVWLGASVESARYKFRADQLRDMGHDRRWLSIEPLLDQIGPLDLSGIGWVVVGGESGPHARPMHPDWAREVRDQCVDAGVPFFFKQWGGRTAKTGGRVLDGRTWDEMPARIVPGES